MSELTWKVVPDEDANAIVNKSREVVGAFAIYVENASIRLATVSGWFEVADVPNPFTYKRGSLQVEVKCLWYGLKPKTEWMHLRIKNKYKLVRQYTGLVVNNVYSQKRVEKIIEKFPETKIFFE